MIRPIVCNTEQPQLRQLCGAACRERTGGVMAAAAYRDSATNYYVPASASALCIRLYPLKKIHTRYISSLYYVLHILLLACSERRMTMNPTHFLVYLAAVFSCPVLRCIHKYIHVLTKKDTSMYLRKYICIDKKGYIVQKKIAPLYMLYITRH